MTAITIGTPHRSRDVLLTSAAMVVMSTAGCTTSHSQSPVSVPSTRVAGASTASTSPASPSTPHQASSTVVDCSDGLGGADLGRGWRRTAVTVGPISFAGLRMMARTAFPPRNGDGVGFYKSAVVVRPGAKALVAIPSSATRFARLDYGPSGSTENPLGAKAAKFVACPEDRTIFSGGFFLRSPHCVPVDITPRPRGPSP